jgi:hypothetical protein
VLMVVARQGADVRRHRARRLLRRAWGARGRGSGGTPDVSPGQIAYHQKKTVSLRVRFGAPSMAPLQDSNLRTRLRSPIPRTATTSGNAPEALPWGAYGAREASCSASATCRSCGHDSGSPYVASELPSAGDHLVRASLLRPSRRARSSAAGYATVFLNRRPTRCSE